VENEIALSVQLWTHCIFPLLTSTNLHKGSHHAIALLREDVDAADLASFFIVQGTLSALLIVL